MTRIIAIANNKGGCGKTTTAASLAAALRQIGRDVLVIDADAQSNLTACFGIKAPAGRTTYDALKTSTPPRITPVRVLEAEPNNPDNPEQVPAGVLDVVPSVADLSAVEAGLTTQADRLTRFRAFADMYRTAYDCIIIDTPPAVGFLTLSALFASDAVIIAVQPQYLAVQGLVTLTGIIDSLNDSGAAIEETRVLFTQFDRRKGLHRLTAEQVTAAGFRAYSTKIRDNVALGEAPAAGLDIFRYAPRSNGAADYSALVDEIQGRNFIKHTKHKYNG